MLLDFLKYRRDSNAAFPAAALERLGLRYFVTGSTVTIFYGEPRFTKPAMDDRPY